MSTLNEYLLHKSKNDKLHESSVGFSSPSPGTGTCENAPCQGHDGMNTSEPIFHKCNESLEPIAIVGMAFRFPGGAVTEDALWDMLLEKRCASSKFPSDRINIDAFHCPEGKRPNTIHTRQAHFLEEDIYAFDPSFFSISPLDAAAMDPCQRALMETTYHALENAGISLEKISATNTSVHVGCFTSDYMTLALRDSTQIPKYAATGVSQAILSNRISWFYDLKGPSLTLDTACSGGIMALDLACQGLWNKRCDAAIVASANILMSPEMNIAMSNLGFLSREGKCFSFDHRATGYARGEGCAGFILKPLSKALAEGNNVRALIRSVRSNQDGRTHGGMMQPSAEMQAALIRETYRQANLDLRDTAVFEAHATGTSVGDPIEASAISDAFSKFHSTEDKLIVGALKPNLGHLEATSGLASIVKTVLTMERGLIPPNTNFEKLNPNIGAERYHLKFPTSVTEWPTGKPRRTSINSFGFGGANAHVIIEDFNSYLQSNGGMYKLQPQLHGYIGARREDVGTDNALGGNDTQSDVELNGLVNTETSLDPPVLLLLSALDESGVDRQAQAHSLSLQGYFRSHSTNLLSNYSYTLAVHRPRLPWSSFCVLEHPAQSHQLSSIISKPTTGLGDDPKLGLVFTGQGAQWPGMGRELVSNPTFLASLHRSDSYLSELSCSFSLIDLVVNGLNVTSFDDARMSQILTTAIQLALVDLIHWFDITPAVVIGHSSGEIAAAYAAGHISARSAMRICYHRGTLGSYLETNSQERCAMAAVGLSKKQMEAELEEAQSDPLWSRKDASLTISCINSPSNVTVSGPEILLDLLIDRLAARQVFARKLRVKLGYHSPQMSTVSQDYLLAIENLEPGQPSSDTPLMVSSVTADITDSTTVCTGSYWVRNMESPVNFLGAVQCCDESYPGFKPRAHVDGWLELGPHSALQGPLRQISTLASSGDKEITYASALIRHKSALNTLLSAAGYLYTRNFSVNLSKVSGLGLTSLQLQSRTILTNLPRYQFNHSIRYLDQPLASSRSRLRQVGNHDLLGTPTADSNKIEAQWVFIIRETDLPWVKDHKLNGVALYPAAGMLVAVVEAAKQLCASASPYAFELMEVEFLAPIDILESGEGVEVRIHMSATSLTSSTASGRDGQYEFRLIHTKANDVHDVVCKGAIRVDNTRRNPTTHADKERIEKEVKARREYVDIKQYCRTSQSRAQVYDDFLNHTKYNYGPEFQPLEEVQLSTTGHAISTLAPYDAGYTSPHAVHPTRLDGLFQICHTALSGMGRPETAMPTSLRKMWLPVTGFGHADGAISEAKEIVFTKATSVLSRTATFDVTVFDKSTLSPKAQIDGLEITSVDTGRTVDKVHWLEDKMEYLTSHVEWKVDIDSLSMPDLQEYCEKARPQECEQSVERFQDFSNLLALYARKALDEIEARDCAGRAPYLDRYVHWLRHHVDDLPSDPTSEELSRLRHKLLPNRLVEMYITIAESLPRILTGQEVPLALFFGEHARINMAEIYTAFLEEGSEKDILGHYLASLVHKRPSLKFLEIGAGTGALTSYVLKAIGEHGSGAAFKNYTFTDISPSFFGKAREKFTRHERKMIYSALDIVQSPADQGFKEESYDVIIADNVLHATKDCSSTLGNVRSLLKPGGKLIIREVTTPSKLLPGFLFGLLPGWWLASEQNRVLSPCLEESDWSEALKKSGFSGTELTFKDAAQDGRHFASIMVTTADVSERSQATSLNASTNSPALIVDQNCPVQSAMASAVAEQLDNGSAPSQLLSLAEAAHISEQCPGTHDFIFLSEIRKPLLADVSERDLISTRAILQYARSLIWTKNNTRSAPEYAITDGLCRVARLENTSLALVTLAVEAPSPSPEPSTVQNIVYISGAIQRSLEIRDSEELEVEYAQIGHALHIPRLQRARSLDSHIHRLLEQPVIRQTFSGQALKLGIQTPGLLDSICFLQDTASKMNPLAANELEVEVKAIGINFKDCLVLLGRFKSDILGFEVAGIVRNKGSAVSDFNVGDRVAVADIDIFRTVVRCDTGHVVRIPEFMEFTHAAAIPLSFMTAYHALVEVARLRCDEKVLIHAATGSIGQAAVQIAQHIGAEILCTVGSDDKKQLLQDQYGIPKDHILYSRDTSFADGIRRITRDGVDVILNSTSGKLLEASWECIAPFGRFIDIGLEDAFAANTLSMSVFTKGVSFSSVDLSRTFMKTDGSTRLLMMKVFQLFEEGALRKVHPLHAFSLKQAEQAFRFLQSGKSSGKLVLEVDKGTELDIVQGPHSGYVFPSNSTFMIAGGLGGLGRGIARWLVSRGAKNLILLTRSGLDGNTQATAMVYDMRAAGVKVQCPRCDITDLESVQSVIRECAGMPPIRGCFQASMVLRDAAICQMTHSSWTQTSSPKIRGTWNLHLALPSDCFFILLSSIVGVVGNDGQASYAAGNSYLDGLAHHLTSSGLRETVISLDLGYVLDEGYVAENKGLQNYLERVGCFRANTLPEIFAILDYYCNPEMVVTPVESQVVMGLEMPANVNAKGGDVPPRLYKPLFKHLHGVESLREAKIATTAQAKTFASAFMAAPTVAERNVIATEALKGKLSQVLGVAADVINTAYSIASYGVDSLIGLELRNWFAKELRADVPVFEIVSNRSLKEVAQNAAKKSTLRLDT